MTESAIVNGEIVCNGVISIDDRGYTLGDGLFETIALYSGKPFKFDYHFERLKTSADRINMSLPMDQEQAQSGIVRLAHDNNVDTGVARLTVSRGRGPRGYGTRGCDSPEWILTCKTYTPMTKRAWEAGLSLGVSSIRIDPKAALRGMKTISSLESVMIFDEALNQNADEVLVITTEGYVASGAAVNVFWVKEDRLYTPSLSCGILPGVARRVVLELAVKEGIRVDEGAYSLETLNGADEVFVTNSLITVAPVRKVAGFTSAVGPGPLTRRFYSLYADLTK